jgi:hypothetical protein
VYKEPREKLKFKKSCDHVPLKLMVLYINAFITVMILYENASICAYREATSDRISLGEY